MSYSIKDSTRCSQFLQLCSQNILNHNLKIIKKDKLVYSSKYQEIHLKNKEQHTYKCSHLKLYSKQDYKRSKQSYLSYNLSIQNHKLKINILIFDYFRKLNQFRIRSNGHHKHKSTNPNGDIEVMLHNNLSNYSEQIKNIPCKFHDKLYKLEHKTLTYLHKQLDFNQRNGNCICNYDWSHQKFYYY